MKKTEKPLTVNLSNLLVMICTAGELTNVTLSVKGYTEEDIRELEKRKLVWRTSAKRKFRVIRPTPLGNIYASRIYSVIQANPFLEGMDESAWARNFSRQLAVNL